jgi:tRNA(His) guanylyltransferase
VTVANDGLGDRCKQFEQAEAGRRAMRGLPLLARLDGRAFHTFTRDMQRPYEPAMSRCMIETARFLVQEMTALIGYTQSDEITLVWYEPSQSPSEYAFDGRFQKVASVLAGMASARFAQLVARELPAKASAVPHFDCRVWQVPTLADAADVFVWREDDATKNSVSMAAGAYYADRELHGKDSAEKQELLFQKGVNWNDYPAFFKRGTYVQRRTYARALTDEERAKIPEAHRPPADATFQRTRVEELELPPVRRIVNLSAVLFEGAAPETR